MIEWDFVSISDGNVGEVRTESKRKLIEPDSKFIKAHQKIHHQTPGGHVLIHHWN
ncbi:MAG: hypothetical protein CM1200mP28_11600 [Deltaproteobacteria bacterium]|nr:MAG: hypothetical protein CM1200mP28_11600 [Deltaproteobacteria bacterium]